MDCAFVYCVYNRGFECILEKININSSGMCGDCVPVKLDEETIK